MKNLGTIERVVRVTHKEIYLESDSTHRREEGDHGSACALSGLHQPVRHDAAAFG